MISLDDMEQELKQQWLREGRPDTYDYFVEIREPHSDEQTVLIVRLTIRREKL